MIHYSEDDLILHYYGEGPRRGDPSTGSGSSRATSRGDVEHHFETCAECAAAYHALVETLQLVVAPEVPERDDTYPLQVWQRIRSRLPEHNVRFLGSPWWQGWLVWRPMTAAAALVVVIIAAIVTGRMPPQGPAAPATALAVDSNEAVARVRVAATGDHLERSERVLLDLVNADGQTVDLTDQQAWAADLIDANRLYRDAAARAGDALVANVLDELERSLLEIVHGPSMPLSAELDDVRGRVDVSALLFKVRILADELHEREIAPVPTRKTT